MEREQLVLLKAQVINQVETIENLFEKVEEEKARNHRLNWRASPSGCTTCTAPLRIFLSW